MDTVNNSQVVVGIVSRPKMTVYDAIIKQLRQSEVYTLPEGEFGKIRLVTKNVNEKSAIILVHEPNARGIQPLNSYVVPVDGGAIDDLDFVVFEFTKITYEFGDGFKGGKVLGFKIWQEVPNRQYYGIRSLDMGAVEAGDVVALKLENNQYKVEPDIVADKAVLEFARKYTYVFVKRVIRRLPVQDARKKYILSADTNAPYIRFMMQENRLAFVEGKGLVRVKNADRKNDLTMKRDYLENIEAIKSPDAQAKFEPVNDTNESDQF